MKVLLVNTGPHAQGNTFTALNEVAKRLQENGVEAEIVQVGTKPVRSCIACGQCRVQGLGRCVFNDDVCKEIARMPKGTISKWIEIDGWCFMLRKDDETSAKNLTFSEAYEQIRMNVIKDKTQDLYKKWIDRLKGRTYIKIY